eukprot:CAMPEP_0177344172 /NCGR_PEP_ID=MMETSP0368-20130122/27970_1 /TAXON_ID=447022 ORGANISM="Scrippsiella hangoei-like, Strain SHHI-4" /NCGR_SAMPLE_ID=MMETSP0368 /ASSEMBLY_ACC=CAM_ASM_000363 /LENGTH=251 /DNA_ID=CAMNT_0018805659 /DNA_START=51 /DNA_END=806 /DNA_ORIENTATION=-
MASLLGARPGKARRPQRPTAAASAAAAPRLALVVAAAALAICAWSRCVDVASSPAAFAASARCAALRPASAAASAAAAAERGRGAAWGRASALQPRSRVRRAAGAGGARMTYPPGLYQALTKVRVRLFPKEDSPSLADAQSQKLSFGEWVGVFEPEDIFKISETRSSNGQTFLKLADQDGWVFAVGIKGEWAGKPIIQAVPPESVLDAQVEGFVQSLYRQGFKNDADRYSVITFAVFIFLFITIGLYVNYN